MNTRKSMRNTRHNTQMVHKRGSDYFLTECFRNTVRLETRELLNRASWNAQDFVSKVAISKLEYWNTNIVEG